MASLTKKTRSIRKRKQSKRGKARKKAVQARGTTPAFAIHKESLNSVTAEAKTKSAEN